MCETDFILKEISKLKIKRWISISYKQKHKKNGMGMLLSEVLVPKSY